MSKRSRPTTAGSPTKPPTCFSILALWRPPPWLFNRLLRRVRAISTPQRDIPLLGTLLRTLYLAKRVVDHLRFMDFSIIPGWSGYVAGGVGWCGFGDAASTRASRPPKRAEAPEYRSPSRCWRLNRLRLAARRQSWTQSLKPIRRRLLDEVKCVRPLDGEVMPRRGRRSVALRDERWGRVLSWAGLIGPPTRPGASPSCGCLRLREKERPLVSGHGTDGATALLGMPDFAIRGRCSRAASGGWRSRRAWIGWAVRRVACGRWATGGDGCRCGICRSQVGRCGWCGRSGSGGVPMPGARRRPGPRRRERIGARALLTERARAEVCRRVGEDGDSVAEVAREFGVGWHAAIGAVAEHGTALVDDPARLGAPSGLGLDETAFLAASATRRREMVTGFVDLDRHRLLDVVRGRSGSGRARLARPTCRGVADRDRSRCGGPVPRLRDPPQRPTGGVTIVVDHFHAVQLGNAAVDDVRRRVQQATLGHRGRKDDPLYRIRRTLLVADDRLNDTNANVSCACAHR